MENKIRDIDIVTRLIEKDISLLSENYHDLNEKFDESSREMQKFRDEIRSKINGNLTLKINEVVNSKLRFWVYILSGLFAGITLLINLI